MARKLWRFTRTWGWRLVGLLFWLQLLAWLFGFGTEVDVAKLHIFELICATLASLGGTPVNTNLLPYVLRLGWILVVCEFRPLYVVGLVLYVFVFPIPFVYWSITRLGKFFSKRQIKPVAIDPIKTKNRRSPRRLPLLSGSGFLLLAWLLVFGDARSTSISAFGAVICGVFFLVFAARTFSNATPNLDKPSMFWWLELPTKFSATLVDQSREKTFKNAKEATGQVETLGHSRKGLVSLMKLLKGRGTRNKAAAIVLVEFIVTSLFLASIAIFFWGLVMKAYEPLQIDLLTGLHSSLSYFLPNIVAPKLTVQLPLWITVGTSATSLILLVVFLSPAGNLIPDKQRLYIENLRQVIRTYRNVSLKLKNEMARLKALSEQLLTKELDSMKRVLEIGATESDKT